MEKRREELALVRAFLEHDGWEVLCAQSACPPKPDVLVEVRRKDERLRLGIEVTEYGNERERGFQGAWTSICETVEEYTRSCPELRQVRALLLPKERPPKNAWDDIAKELVSLAREVIENAGGARNLDAMRISRFCSAHPQLARFLRHVLLQYTPREIPRWRPGKAGGFGWSGVWKWVRRSVARKAAKLPRYDRSDVDEVWLLLCAAGCAGRSRSMANVIGPRRLPGASANPPQDVLDMCSRSGFQRVLLWDAWSGCITELS